MLKFIITTTIPESLNFFIGVCAVSSDEQQLKIFANTQNVRYKYIPMSRKISLLSDLYALFGFILYFFKERPYVVHGNTPKASLLSMLAAWITRRPVRIYMCHGLRYETTTGLLLRVLKTMEWISCHCATHVIGVSQGVVERLVSDRLCDKKKIKVIGFGTAGGIDTDRFSRDSLSDEALNKRLHLGIGDSEFVFCFVGRIVKDKGVNELIEAFNRLSIINSNTHLLLIGSEEGESDPLKIQTKELIKTHGRIHYLGRRDDVRPFIAASNALVLPSYREGVGQVILEANALDVPCIATDIVGPRDVIEPLINGELVPVKNVEALYDKMYDWVANPNKVAKMSKTSRNFVEARYKQDVVKMSYFQEYLKLAGL